MMFSRENSTWISKLNDTTQVTLDFGPSSSWKVWTKITEEPPVDDEDTQTETRYRFKFIVRQDTGKRIGCKIGFIIGKDCRYETKVDYYRYSIAEEYTIISKQFNDYQFRIKGVIYIGVGSTYNPKLEGLKKGDYLFQVGEEKFSIYQTMWPVSEKLLKLVDKSTDSVVNSSDNNLPRKGRIVASIRRDQQVEREEVPFQLHGVDCDALKAVINDPSLAHVNITVEKCRSLAEIERRYGIKCYSEKVRKMLEMDFWNNTDKLDRKILGNEEEVTVTAIPEMKISKTYRAPSLPNKYTITAFYMDFDIYMYIQEYNGTSYVSIGVISDKHFSRVIRLNIQLHHPQNPEFNRSADISRKFNNYQRTAGCSTFMLSSELSEYMHKDGSYIITISLSPTVITNDILYPGIKDVVLCNGDERVNVSRDLLFHYCDYFKTVPNSDNLSADHFPFESIKMMMDLIYHRSMPLTINNIQQLLTLSETILCPFAHNYCDRLLADQYQCNLLSINQIKEFLDNWDLPELMEAKQMMSYTEPKPKNMQYERKVFDSEYPIVDRIVRSIGIQEVLEVILPADVIDKEKMEVIMEKLKESYGKEILNNYRKALYTLEGAPQRLKKDLRVFLSSRQAPSIPERLCGMTKRLEEYGVCCGDGGCPELAEQVAERQEMVKYAIVELSGMFNGEKAGRRAIDKILSISERTAEKGRRDAVELLWKWMENAGPKYSQEELDSLTWIERESYVDSLKNHQIKLEDWMDYMSNNDVFCNGLYM